MASKKECDQYAAEVMRRFDEVTRWAKDNWPNRNFPLHDSDFNGLRYEIGRLLGPKLNDGVSGNDQPGMPDANESRQYVDVTPAPWP